MCHTFRFCEWRLALTISHSQVKRTAAGHSAFGDPGEWIGTDTWKMKQVISEWTHVVVKIAFWIRQRCQKWHKTQLIHWQANSFFFCCFFFFKWRSSAVHAKWHKHSWATLPDSSRAETKLPEDQLTPVCVRYWRTRIPTRSSSGWKGPDTCKRLLWQAFPETGPS